VVAESPSEGSHVFPIESFVAARRRSGNVVSVHFVREESHEPPELIRGSRVMDVLHLPAVPLDVCSCVLFTGISPIYPLYIGVQVNLHII